MTEPTDPINLVATARPLAMRPSPTASTMRAHLAGLHDMPTEVLNAHAPTEHAAWHAAEHRTRDPKPGAKDPRHAGHLDHTHPGVHAACATFVADAGGACHWCASCGWRWDAHADERTRRGPAAVARWRDQYGAIT